jgi:hypothetical protein
VRILLTRAARACGGIGCIRDQHTVDEQASISAKYADARLVSANVSPANSSLIIVENLGVQPIYDVVVYDQVTVSSFVAVYVRDCSAIMGRCNRRGVDRPRPTELGNAESGKTCDCTCGAGRQGSAACS